MTDVPNPNTPKRFPKLSDSGICVATLGLAITIGAAATSPRQPLHRAEALIATGIESLSHTVSMGEMPYAIVVAHDLHRAAATVRADPRYTREEQDAIPYDRTAMAGLGLAAGGILLSLYGFGKLR